MPPPPVPWFDAHNHLHDERFAGRQPELVAACRAAGIRRMVVNGSCEADWPAVAALAAAHPDLIIPAFGLHPWYVHERTPLWAETLVHWLDRTPGAVIGEIGLDRWILDCPPAARAGVSTEPKSRTAASLPEQLEVFVAQLRWAAEREVTASVHCLQAWGAMLEVLRAGPLPRRGILLHSYGGSEDLVAPLTRLGAYFGFPGYFMHERKARQRAAFRAVRADRLLVETDAPDQRLPGPAELARVTGDDATAHGPAPREVPGSDGRPLNHPANLPLVYRGLAAVRRQGEEALAAQVEANFGALFPR
jgi:TatD DNase family protein